MSDYTPGQAPFGYIGEDGQLHGAPNTYEPNSVDVEVAESAYHSLVVERRRYHLADREARRQADALEQATGAAEDYPFHDGAEFLFNQPDKIPARWGRGDQILWGKGEALMVCGPPGVGKTTLTGQVVRALLGLQHEVLGFPVEPVGRVLYLAMDRPRQIARALARHFAPEDRGHVHGRLTVWQGPPPGDLAQNTDLLLDLAVKAAADVVIVDSLKDAAVGLSEDAVGAGYNRARQKVLAAGIDVMELHHQKKAGANGAKPDKLADVYGSTWLTSGAGSVIGLWGDAGDPLVELSHLKPVMEPVGPFNVLHDHTAGVSTVEGEIDLVALAKARSGLTVGMAAEALFGEKPKAAEREKARRRLLRMVKEGHLEKDEMTDDAGRDVSVYRAARTTRGTTRTPENVRPLFGSQAPHASHAFPSNS